MNWADLMDELLSANFYARYRAQKNTVRAPVATKTTAQAKDISPEPADKPPHD